MLGLSVERTTARGWGMAAIALVLVAAGCDAGPTEPTDQGPTPTATARPLPSGSPAPTAPPVALCDRAEAPGSAAAPAGAVVVKADQNLADVVGDQPAGTTYWLTQGVHKLERDLYSQVIPQAGDTFIGAPGAVLDGQRTNRYAFGGTAADVTIRSLTVQNFGSTADNNNEGVVNHDSAPGWTIESSTIQRNAGAGIMLGSQNRLVGNCLRDNGQYGFSVYHPDGVQDIVLEGNEITGNNTDDWERRRPGCGCTGGGKFWATRGGVVTGNYVHDNRGVGLWADTNNVGFLFQGNFVSGNDAEGLMYETSYNAAILDNTFVRNALVKGPTNPGFPASAIYLSEAGSDPRVSSPYNQELVVARNTFIDNWSGVVAWENADRYAGSPANTSTGASTLVNPDVATVEACAKRTNIRKQPYVDDCRWKTQNVVVDSNTFRVDPAQIRLCVASKGCGFNGLFSNFGTYPPWTPYLAHTVEKNVTFKQNNAWRNNTYVGDWHFVVEEAGKRISWDEWQAAPYNQDVDSTTS